MLGPARRSLLAAAVVALGGCAWLSGTKKPEPGPLPALSNAVSVTPAWRVSASGRAGIGFQPAFAGGSVWAATRDGAVMRIDALTGRIQWRTELGQPLTAGVGTDGSIAVVAARDGSIIALDGEGKRLWNAPVGAEVLTPPAVAERNVLVRASDNRILAFDAGSGKRRWSLQRTNPPLVLRQTGGIAVSRGDAFFGLPGGRLLAVAIGTGAPRWDVPVALPRGTTELERIVDVVGSPVVTGLEVCAASFQGRIGCFDAVNGRPVWTRDFSSASGVDVDPRLVFSPDADDVVHAFGRNGTPLWTQEALRLRKLSAPLSQGSALVLGDGGGLVHWLMRDDGSVAARATTDGSAIVAAPLAVGQFVVVQTSNGALHAFEAR